MKELEEFARLLKQAKPKVDVPVPSQSGSFDLIESLVEDFGEPTPSNEDKPAFVDPPSPTVPAVVEESVGNNAFVIKQLQKELDMLKKSLDQMSSRMSQTATYSGGGVSSEIDLERPSRQVTSNYTLTYRDYYVEVVSDNIVEITMMPRPNNGKQFVIKDISGHANLTPIRILGNIDGDPDGVELSLNYGSITLMYFNGWKII